MLGSGCFVIFFFKQKTAYEMRISDWSSDVCSSDLTTLHRTSVTRSQGVWLVLDIFGVKCEALHIRCPFFRLNGFLSFFSSHAIFLFVLYIIAIVSTLRGARINVPSAVEGRSEERRVGKECVSTCRARGSRYH